MGRDGRRGKRRYQPGSRPAGSRPPGQPAVPTPGASQQEPNSGRAPARPSVSSKGPAWARPAPRMGTAAKLPVLANPHLGRDLRNIGIVTALLVVLLIVLWLVL